MENVKTLILGIAIAIGALLLIGFSVFLGTLPLSSKFDQLDREVKVGLNELRANEDAIKADQVQLAEIEEEYSILQNQLAKQAEAYRNLKSEYNKVVSKRDALINLLDQVQSSNEALQTQLPPQKEAEPAKKSGVQKDIERSLALATVSLFNREWGYGTADINYPNAVQPDRQLLVRRDNKPLGIVLISEVTPTNEAVFQPLANNFPETLVLNNGDELITVPAGYLINE